MPTPVFQKYFDDDDSPDDSVSRRPGSSPSSCEQLGWIVVAVLSVYLVASIVTWLFQRGGSACARAGSASGKIAHPGAGAVRLTSDAQLEAVVVKPKATVVIFHAPWCGHCAKTVPVYEAAAARCGGSTECYTADCAKDITSAVFSKYGVQGFPTIIRFDERGTPSEFEGPRTEEAMLSFMNGA